MSRMQRMRPYVLVLCLVLLTACGDEGKGDDPRESSGSPRALSTSDLPTLRVTTNEEASKVVDSVFEGLFATKRPTGEVLAEVLGEHDPHVVNLVDTLRAVVLSKMNRGWVDPGTNGLYWAEERGCSPEALEWRVGMKIELHFLRLPRSVGEKIGARYHLAPLKGSLEAVLQAARAAGLVVCSPEPVTLRGGEAARFVDGWTRARRVVQRLEDGTVQTGSLDVFSGLQVEAHAQAEDQAGPWRLRLYVRLARLQDEDSVGELSSAVFGQSQHVQSGIRLRESNAVDVVEEAQCWVLWIDSAEGEDPYQLVVCASLEDI